MRKQVVIVLAGAALLVGCSADGSTNESATTTSGSASATEPMTSGSPAVVVAADLAGGRQICSLVTSDEVSAAFGVKAATGVPGTDGARNSCTFIMADNNVVVAGLLNWSDELAAEADASSAIDGIGDRACFQSPTLNVKRGDLDLVIVETANNLAGAAALAKVVVPKL